MMDAARIAELERRDWIRAKAGGKRRFILRQGILPTVAIWVGVSLITDLIERNWSRSLLSTLTVDLLSLPIFLVGGYLEGV